MSGETMTLQINGAPRPAAAGLTLSALLLELGAGGPGVAVAVNDEVVRRDEQARTVLQPGDRIEIIQAVGGG